MIRTPVVDIRVAGRNTQGVTLFKTAEGEKVVSVTALEEGKTEDDDEDGIDLETSETSEGAETPAASDQQDGDD